jgi:hypothetical protein
VAVRYGLVGRTTPANEKRDPATLMKTKMSRKKGQLRPLVKLLNEKMQAETKRKDDMLQENFEKSCGLRGIKRLRVDGKYQTGNTKQRRKKGEHERIENIRDVQFRGVAFGNPVKHCASTSGTLLKV